MCVVDQVYSEERWRHFIVDVTVSFYLLPVFIHILLHLGHIINHGNCESNPEKWR
jgi:hypothetical protein